MKIKVILAILLLSLTLVSCGTVHVEDTNGSDDYSLCYFKEADLVTNVNSTSLVSVSSTGDNEFKYSCKKLTGTRYVKTIKTNGDDVLCKVNISITEGNACVGLVTETNIIHIFPLNQTSEYIVYSAYSEVYFKILGESANIKVSVELSKA